MFRRRTGSKSPRGLLFIESNYSQCVRRNWWWKFKWFAGQLFYKEETIIKVIVYVSKWHNYGIEKPHNKRNISISLIKVTRWFFFFVAHFEDALCSVGAPDPLCVGLVGTLWLMIGWGAGAGQGELEKGWWRNRIVQAPPQSRRYFFTFLISGWLPWL